MPAKRAAALAAGAAGAFDPADPGARKAVLAASTGGVYAVADFVGSDSSLAFATGVLARGGKVVVTGLIGGGFSTAVAMFPIKAMTIEGTLTGTLARGARGGRARAQRQGRADPDPRAPAARRPGRARRPARRQGDRPGGADELASKYSGDSPPST